MKRNELLFWAVVLLASATVIRVTEEPLWAWPVFFTAGWFIGTVLAGRRE